MVGSELGSHFVASLDGNSDDVSGDLINDEAGHAGVGFDVGDLNVQGV